ncbi:MAG: cell division protein FtsZ [Candidatus Asgardarchaeia archaeon]
MSTPPSFLVRDAFQNAKLEKKIRSIDKYRAKIVVVGTGGAGCNTINRLMTIGIKGAYCIACNTDKQHLDVVKAHRKILLGPSTTRGLGAGGFPQVGAAAAEESKDVIRDALDGADLVFVAAGMGGGTGTGSAPIIAQIAKDEIGAIVVGVVTMPFEVEMSRIEKAREGLEQLREHTNTVIVIDNNKLLDLAGDQPLEEAFSLADEILAAMVKGITETINDPSLINLDFADVRTVLRSGGVAMVGIGEAGGKKEDGRAKMALENALNSPLLTVDITGAKGALIHVTGGRDMTLREAESVPRYLHTKMDPNANVIFGARVDPRFNGYIRVIVIITGVKSPNILGPKQRRLYAYQGVQRRFAIDDDGTSGTFTEYEDDQFDFKIRKFKFDFKIKKLK